MNRSPLKTLGMLALLAAAPATALANTTPMTAPAPFGHTLDAHLLDLPQMQLNYELPTAPIAFEPPEWFERRLAPRATLPDEGLSPGFLLEHSGDPIDAPVGPGAASASD